MAIKLQCSHQRRVKANKESTFIATNGLEEALVNESKACTFTTLL